MLFVSLLHQMGFASEASRASGPAASLQSRPDMLGTGIAKTTELPPESAAPATTRRHTVKTTATEKTTLTVTRKKAAAAVPTAPVVQGDTSLASEAPVAPPKVATKIIVKTPKVLIKPSAEAGAAVAEKAAAAKPDTAKPDTVKPAADPAPAETAPVITVDVVKPLGKRAAKKVMLEQMTQAAVVPTHAPDAAKATFSQVGMRPAPAYPVPVAQKKDPARANNWKVLPLEQLTDQDVLAMPDSEYMGDLQLAFFRRKLVQLRTDMLTNAGETTEHLREDTVVVPDPADRATIEEEHALELRTRDRERKLLKKIEQAIARIDAGDYGYCDETGEIIGVGRLLARPTASLSLEAQQRRELKQKMFGD
ncbi:MAG: polymerase-binding protein DksA [Pseudomonadota bacterium]|jgi:DnaK suppressor protein